jgi:hypothetical protein
MWLRSAYVTQALCEKPRALSSLMLSVDFVFSSGGVYHRALSFGLVAVYTGHH